MRNKGICLDSRVYERYGALLRARVYPRDEPRIVYEDDSFIVAEKPHNMHSAPLNSGDRDNMSAWLAKKNPDLTSVFGWKEGECGLINRLDMATHGLVLAARTQKAFDNINGQQRRREIIKTYYAFCARSAPPDFFPPFSQSFSAGSRLTSFFRPYGSRGRLVAPLTAPLTAKKARVREEYSTCVIEREELALVRFDQPAYPPKGREANGADAYVFKCAIKKGFRHQIRAHLAWAGYPIINDELYGGARAADPPVMELHACALEFVHPASGERARFSIFDAD